MRYALILLVLCSNVLADTPVVGKVREITIMGRDNITVTQRDVTLGDLAEVTTIRPESDEVIIGLKRIKIDQSPEPGKRKSIAAERIIERLREEGVSFSNIGYSFPKEANITRASRNLTLEEITGAVAKFIENTGRDLSLKRVDFRGPFHIAPGIVDIQPISSNFKRPGELGVDLRILVDGREERKIGVTALVDEFKEIPVAARPIIRGEVIEERDVVRARLNVNEIPRDAADENIVGQASATDVPEGKAFKRGTLSEPLIVQKNAKVTLLYRSGGLEASATGVALEGGAMNQSIRVRNDASQKVISGKVTDQGSVIVSSENVNRGGTR